MCYIVDLLSEFINPIFLAFLIIALGTIIGSFSFKGISFSSSAVLILSVFLGMIFSFKGSGCDILNDEFFATMKNFSSLGTALFVTSVAFSAGYSFRKQKKFNYKPFFIGAFIVVFNFLILFTVLKLNLFSLSYELLCGLFCGSMTSTPGLAALCEIGNVNYASSGYACSYLIGVLTIVLFTQGVMKSKKFCFFMHKQKKIQTNLDCYDNKKSILFISLSIVLGYIIGTIKIFGFSFGTSAGFLISGIIVVIVSKKTISSSILNFIRELGLVMFFVGTGIVSGTKAVGNLNFICALWGALFAFVPIALGFLISMILYKRNIYQSLCVVCGAMTSTPAISVVLKENDQADVSDYSMSYTGALFVMVLGMRIIPYLID